MVHSIYTIFTIFFKNPYLDIDYFYFIVILNSMNIIVQYTRLQRRVFFSWS